MRIVLTQFVMRQFKSDFAGTKIIENADSFEYTVNGILIGNQILIGDDGLIDGYAPFCKHLFIINGINAKCGTVKITPENEKYLKSGYNARRESELPVLSRWFESKDVEVEKADWLDIILYDKEQLEKEGEDIGMADYGIVSVNAVRFNREDPMPPITAMRNALGIEYGGSGALIDKDAYMKSVEFWSQYAIVL